MLATTEAGKVLPTVVDRCHRFDFARPTVEQLSRVLRRVAEQESIEIAPDALALLARHATGSFRDALGTLEQLVTYTGTEIAADDVLAVLGVADEDVLFGALDAIASHDAAAALSGGRALRRERARPGGRRARSRDTRARAARRPHARPRAGRAARDAGARRAARGAGAAPSAADLVRLLELLAEGQVLDQALAEAEYPSHGGLRHQCGEALQA